ncbi:MAG: hypothetical protein IPM53_09030 [Anaerolineaceae bacterium]|nr:hypothetical protein [Anaerolineaceae bacterium]
MKQLSVLFFSMILLVGLATAGCTSGGETETAVAQTDTTVIMPTPTAFPSPNPEMPRPDSCPITRPPETRFIPPAPYPEWPPGADFWYGTNALWTDLRSDGIWYGLPKSDDGYGNKIALWHEGYSQAEEPRPAITLSARQLDGDAVVEPSVYGTNAYHPDYGQFMMTGIELPTLGCWEITAEYQEAALSFVVWVTP